jgi:ATP-dependent Clp protease ATP-binding subunit ClpA
LGLLREEEGLAARVLESLDITVERVRAQVVRIVGSGEEATSGQIPFTPRAKKVLELALREALSLGHNEIATEHILLGLVRENEGVAMRILLDFDADAETVRNEVIRMLHDSRPRARVRLGTGSHVPNQEIDRSWLGGLAPALRELEREVKQQLERVPDSADLLLALACAPETRAAKALRSLGVDLEALAAAVTQVRAQSPPSEVDLARSRDLAKALADTAVQPQTIAHMRSRLGLEPRT